MVGAKSSLLGNNTRQYVGIVSTVAFDEVQIEFSKPVNVNLGDVKIYGVEIQRSCDHALACNTVNTIINTPSGFGAVINNERSGVSGVVCAGCTISDIGNVTDASATNYARMIATAGVAATTAISVHAPASTFSAGTIAGFTIRTNSSLVGLDLFKAISIETYNNGVKTGSASGSQLLSLELLQLLTVGTTNGAVYNVGFVTTAPYDEIRIAKSELVAANVLAGIDIDVYYATVDTRFVTPGSGSSCPVVYTLPDINYTTINKPVEGSVATNDKQPANATYSGGTEVMGADGQGNPTGATLALHSNGTYEFTATQTGVYSYETIMTDPVSGKTYKENLTITVTDPAGTNPNPPVVNTDIAAVKSNTGAGGYTGVTIPVLENDKASNTGKTLGTPTIPVGGQPHNGTASVNGNGTITYIPNPGFVGTDTLTYRVCEETGGAPCGNAYVVIKVTPNETTVTTPGGPVTVPASGNIVAADDYNQTEGGQTAAGNVATNDKDPLGHSMSVATQSINDARGTFTLNADGSYTFAPASGFSGTASFEYVISDANNSSRSAKGTLYVHVAGSGTADLSISLLLSPTQIAGSGTEYLRVTVFNLSEIAADKEIKVLIPIDPKVSNIVFDPVATTFNGSAVENAKWDYLGIQDGFYAFKRKEAIAAAQNGGVVSSRFGFSFTYTSPNGGGKEAFTSYLIYDGDNGDSNSVNNSDAEELDYRN